MRGVVGGLLVLIGAAIGAIVGFWLMLVGGVVQIIEACKLTPVPASEIAFGIVRVVAAAPLGWLLCIPLAAVGIKMILSND